VGSLFKSKRDLVKDMSTSFTSFLGFAEDPFSPLPLMTLLSCLAESRPLRSSSIAFIRLVETPRLSMFPPISVRFCFFHSQTHTQLNYILCKGEVIYQEKSKEAPTCRNVHMLKEPGTKIPTPFNMNMNSYRSVCA